MVASSISSQPALRADADERALLGACLIDPSLVADVKVAASDFFQDGLRETFAAMRAIVDRGDLPIFTALCTELANRGRKVQPSAVLEWINDCPTSTHATHHARNVSRASQRRRLLSASGNVASVALDPAVTSDNAVRLASELIADVRSVAVGASVVADAMTSIALFAAHTDGIRNGTNAGVGTGYPDLDRVLSGGLRAGQLCVIGGRPGMGKSAMLRDMARAMALRSARILYASNEMSVTDLVARDVAVMSEVALSTIVSGRWAEHLNGQINAALTTMEFMPLITLADGALSTDSLRTRASRLHAEEPLAAIVVDYLQRMADPGRTDLERVSRTARALKSLAMELGIPVVAGSQLSRTTERENPDSRPTLIDLRNSGEIEQESDIVLLLYRPGYHYATEDAWRKAHKAERYPGNEAELVIAKQRQGASGVTVPLLWVPALATFRSAAQSY